MKKRVFTYVAAVFIAGGLVLPSFGDDVYAKAFYWCRGMGVDANGNGKLDSGELYDIEIPEGVMRATGNELKMANTAAYVQGRYFAPDYVRLYLVDRPNGAMLIIR